MTGTLTFGTRLLGVKYDRDINILYQAFTGKNMTGTLTFGTRLLGVKITFQPHPPIKRDSGTFQGVLRTFPKTTPVIFRYLMYGKYYVTNHTHPQLRNAAHICRLGAGGPLYHGVFFPALRCSFAR